MYHGLHPPEKGTVANFPMGGTYHSLLSSLEYFECSNAEALCAEPGCGAGSETTAFLVPFVSETNSIALGLQESVLECQFHLLDHHIPSSLTL